MRRGNGSRARTVRASAKVAAQSRTAAAEEWIRLGPGEAALAAVMAGQRQPIAPGLENYLRQHADEVRKMGVAWFLRIDCT